MTQNSILPSLSVRSIALIAVFATTQFQAQTHAGLIDAWGINNFAQADAPVPNGSFVEATGGVYHSMGLKDNGSIQAWGSYASGQLDVPLPNSDYIAIAGNGSYSAALRSDGSVEAWGYDLYGATVVPSLGARCVNSGCAITTSIACVSIGGTYQGDHVFCDVAVCPTSCTEDLNSDGIVNVADLLQIVGAWGICP